MIAVIIAQGIIFVVLIFVLRTFMKGHVTGAVDHLQKMNEELVKQQASLKSKIAAAEKEHQVKLSRLNQEIAEKQDNVRQEANRTLEESRETALKERERLINEAVETKERMRKEVMAEMEGMAIDHSKIMIGDFFSDELKKIIHDHLVDEIVAGISEMKMDAYQIKETTADLISPIKLTDKQKEKIKNIIETKMKKKITFNESEDKELVGGAILKFGTLVIDGSLINKLNESAAAMKRLTAKKYQKSI